MVSEETLILSAIRPIRVKEEAVQNKIRTMTPKGSLNKIGEYYSQGNPARRRTIVKDQINSNKAAAPAYHKAFPVIHPCGAGGLFDSNLLSEKIEALERVRSGTDWVKSDRANTILALKHWQETAGRLSIPKTLTLSKGEHAPAKLQVGGVSISVRPDLIISGIMRGQKVLGAVKFHFSKNPSHRLTRDGGHCVAVLTQQFLEKHVVNNEIVKPNLCFSVDVFGEQVVTAPKNQRNLFKSIEAACEEYGLRFKSMSANILG